MTFGPISIPTVSTILFEILTTIFDISTETIEIPNEILKISTEPDFEHSKISNKIVEIFTNIFEITNEDIPFLNGGGGGLLLNRGMKYQHARGSLAGSQI